MGRVIHAKVLTALSRPEDVLTNGLTAPEIVVKLYPSTHKPYTAYAKSVDHHAGVYNAIRELEMEHRIIADSDSPPRYTITSRGKESFKDQ